MLSPGGEAGAVHVGGAFVSHVSTTLADGGLLVLSNSTAHAAPGQPPTAASRQLVGVDAAAREIKLGGAGGATIVLRGAVTIDATWPASLSLSAPAITLAVVAVAVAAAVVVGVVVVVVVVRI